MDIIYTMLSLGIAAICITLIIHPQYEDGLFGRLALGLLALAELSIFWDSAVDGRHYTGILGTTMAIQIGVFLFFLRHLYRFIRWSRTGEHTWRPAKK